MELSIRHITRYSYTQAPRSISQLLRLTPASSPYQSVIDWQINTAGTLSEFTDSLGNKSHLLIYHHPEPEINIIAEGRVHTSAGESLAEALLAPAMFLRASPLTYCDTAIKTLADVFSKRPRTTETVWELAQAIHKTISFTLNITNSAHTAAEALALGGGVCQDFTHIFIACCRHLKIPARYVSGYLYLPDSTAPQKASHAWAECWLDHEGWIGIDTTNLTLCNEYYVMLARGFDYLDACPVRGSHIGGKEEQLQIILEVGII